MTDIVVVALACVSTALAIMVLALIALDVHRRSVPAGRPHDDSAASSQAADDDD